MRNPSPPAQQERTMKKSRRWLILTFLAYGLGCSSDSEAPGAGSGTGGSGQGTGGNSQSSGGNAGSSTGGNGESGSTGTGGSTSGSGGSDGTDAEAPADGDIIPPTPDAGNGFVPSAACEAKVKTLLGQMNIDQKVGQMLLVERQKASPSQVTQYGLGGVLTAADAHPEPNTPNGWADEVDSYHQAALASANKIPAFYAIDAVHGNAELPGSTVFPHNIGLGATRDAALVEKVGQIVALELGGVGLDFTFAPMVAVARDDRWGREDESFGETPDLSGPLGAALIRGFQGTTIGSGPAPVIGCAKHFAADGATKYGSASGGPNNGGIDRGNAIIDEPTLMSLHVKPYESAIPAGVGSVMATVSSWNGVKGHSNKHLLTEVLKGTLGFKGFVVSDYDGIDQTVPGASAAEKYTTALNAGIDMVMTSGDSGEGVAGTISAEIALIKGLVPSKVSQERLDDAVSRILLTKCMMGLFESPGKADRALTANIGSTEHRTVARQAVRESLVLLKNDGNVLPIAKNVARIHLGGKTADNIANQCGGWTIDWQGTAGGASVGTTVRKAITAVVGASKVTYAVNGSGGAGAGVGVAVIGETPYAEWYGDKADLAIDAADVAAVKAMKDAGLKTVVVLVTGRPMILDKILPLADAVIAAWLPGTEGEGIADVLFGDYKPTGKLPQSWPKSMAQIPINTGDATYDPLFAYGFGLTYP
jgi:beta-glucosidase